MAKILNLGKVVGSDAKINGQTAITLTGANGVSVVTSGTDVTVDGAGIKTELTTHISNTDIHVTAEEKAAWNGKAELSDIPSSLPANGGNADTLGNIPASELERVRTAIMAGEAMGLQWTAMQARKDDTMIRVQADVDYDKIILGKSIDGGVTWTEIPLGNADTVDGKHASDFAQMRGDIADCDDAIAFGTYNITPETKNAPTANYYHLVVEPAANGAWIKQTAVLSDSTVSLINSFTRININGGEWSEWTSSCVNADTVDGLHANEIASNPNLLINPDFTINQRAQTEYTITGFTVDHWFSQRFFTITPITTGIRIVPTEAISENLYGLCQKLPISTAMRGNDYTLTINVATTNDYAHAAIYAYNAANSVVKSSDKIKLQTGVNSVTIKKLPDTTAYIRVQFTIDSGAQPSDVLEVSWAKLELGSIATPFTPPDPATELAKCQRYFNSLFVGSGIPVQFIGSGIAVNDSMVTILVNLPIEMRSPTPTVSLVGTLYLSDGSHNAENSITVQGISGSYLNRNVLQLNLTSNATLDRTAAYLLSRRDTDTTLTVSAEL